MVDLTAAVRMQSQGLKRAGIAAQWMDLGDLQTSTQTDSGIDTAAQQLSDAIQVCTEN